jgi:hypothetical protein
MSESNNKMTTEQKIDKILTLAIDTSEDVKDVKMRLTNLENTVNSHTATLDGLAKDVKRVLDEKTVSAARFDRLEKWAQLVGQKLDIKLEL